MTARSWCYTCFEDEHIAAVGEGTLVLHDELTYHQAQVEVGEQGHLHVQGWVVFKNPARMSRVKRVLAYDTVHVEKTRGSNEANTEYCEKEEGKMSDTLYLGTRPAGRGARSDLLGCKRAFEEGLKLADLFRDDDTFVPAVKYHRGLEKAREALQPQVARGDVDVRVLWGEPGSGKTRAAHQLSDDLYVVDPPNQYGGAVWWDGYVGQTDVLLDDYQGWLPWAQLLRVLDRYPMRVQAKGSSTPLMATRVWLTSNTHPGEWHPRQNYFALKRRIRQIWRCDKDVYTLERD